MILAAGGSSRLGRPKQLLEFEGKTFIERACSTALDSGAVRVCVVLGAHSAEILPYVDQTHVEVAVNEGWASGMASSLRVGLERMRELDAVGFLLVDQPMVSSDHLRSLFGALGGGISIAGSRYPNGVVGVPAAFDRSEFAALMALDRDSGARELIRMAGERVAMVELCESADVDTAEEYETLCGSVHP